MNPNISPFPSAKIGFIPFRNNFDKHTRSPISEVIYYIETGLARTYYYKDGREVTDWLSAENQFAGSMVIS